MMNRCRYLSIIVGLLFSLSAFAQNGRVVVANTASKELKRAAHRLRVPVDQLKNARNALQEATDLVKKIDPYPMDQLYMLGQHWSQLNRPKAKQVIDGFIEDLRSRAAGASDPSSYQRATSAAMMLAQSTDDYEGAQRLLDNWPEPKEKFGDTENSMLKSFRSSVENQLLYRLVNEDPERALDLLEKSHSSEDYRYSMYAQVAQGLMNAGKKEAALGLIDQTITNFSQHAGDPRALQDYENFLRMITMNMDSGRAATAVDQWLTQVMKQPDAAGCSGTLKSDDYSVDLNCSEFKTLNLLRSMSMKPGMVMRTLDGVPELKSKLDSIGGVDSLYSGSNLLYNPPPGVQKGVGIAPGTSNTTTPENPMVLLRQLKGKADSNPALVKRKLQEAVKGPESLSFFTGLANMASWQDPELASLALEVAQPLLSQVEPLSKRASDLQNLIQTYRQVDGSVDTGLLKDGFILADQMREEASKTNSGAAPVFAQARPSWAGDQLESFLLSELSRDSFEDAMRYVRSMENDTFKLQCIIQIVQALRSNY